MLALRLPPEVEKRLAALPKLEDVRAGRGDTVPLADLVKRYGVDD